VAQDPSWLELNPPRLALHRYQERQAIKAPGRNWLFRLPLVIGISSDGAAPTFAQAIRAKLAPCTRCMAVPRANDGAGKATPLQGTKEFLKFASRMDPASATAFSSVLNAAVSSSQRRDPHK